MSDLLEARAVVQVRDAAELVAALKRCFAPEGAEEAAALGRRAADAVRARQGVVPRCVAEIRAAIR